VATDKEQAVINAARLVRDYWFYGKVHDIGQAFAVHAMLRFALRDLGDFDPTCMTGKEIIEHMARYGTPRQHKKKERIEDPV